MELVCPECRVELEAAPASYRCLNGHCFQVIDGLASFVAPVAPGIEHTRRSFDLQWKKSKERGEYNHFDPAFRERLVGLFLHDVMMPASAFNGMRVLDAGCGVGRWTYAMSQLGAHVTAIDYNDEAAKTTLEHFRNHPSVRVMQADIHRLPFRPGSFDFVFSWGVLHHTGDTRRAFDKLVPLVAPGGTLFVMLYEYYNPMKLWISDQVRRWTVPMDRERLYRLCELAARACSYRAIRYSLKPFIDIGWSAEGNYDSFAKALNHHHTAEEVHQWFTEAGFREVAVNGSRALQNPVLRMMQGRWGGTVRMRGTRVEAAETIPSSLQVIGTRTSYGPQV